MNVETYADGNLSMQPWPGLAAMGKTLELEGGKLFFFDSDAGAQKPGNPDTSATSSVVPEISVSTKQNLVLIHGCGDEADTWRHLIPLLCADGHRVIAPDLPGFGRSTYAGGKAHFSGSAADSGNSVWKEKININNYVKTVLSLMQETGVTNGGNKVILAGSSMGAFIAQIIAAKHPDLVKAMILLDACYPLSGSLDKSLVLMSLPFIGRKWYRGFQKDHEAAWRSLYPYYHNLDAMSKEDKEFLRQRVIDRVESSSQEEAYFSSLRSLIRLSFFANNKLKHGARDFPEKILLLWGESDRIIPVVKASEFRSLRPDAEFRLISGAGHLPHQEAPGKTAEVILRFLEGVDRNFAHTEALRHGEIRNE